MPPDLDASSVKIMAKKETYHRKLKEEEDKE